MTVFGYRLQIIHHNNCTYCIHRLKKPRMVRVRKGKKVPEMEICAISQKEIPAPLSGQRFCGYYQQIECECDPCQAELVPGGDGIIMFQTDDSIDKRAKPC